jgi:hypothetical protein
LIRRKTVSSPSSIRTGESVRPWVVDELAAATGEDRWTAGETWALLLAAAGRRASDTVGVRGHSSVHRGVGGDWRAASEACALLLASPSRGTSEPAAVHSDAGPNPAAAGTDGIGGCWSSSYRNRSPAGWDKERCLKSGPPMAEFRLCWFGISYGRGRFQMKAVSH